MESSRLVGIIALTLLKLNGLKMASTNSVAVARKLINSFIEEFASLDKSNFLLQTLIHMLRLAKPYLVDKPESTRHRFKTMEVLLLDKSPGNITPAARRIM